MISDIFINPVNTMDDWFEETVEDIANMIDADFICWEFIDADDNNLGDLAGWFSKDGKIYRASFSESESDKDFDCVVFVENKGLTTITKDGIIIPR